MLRNISVSPAPHIGQALSTRRLMIDVIIALVPAVILAGYFFRTYALILIATCVISSVLTEFLCNLIRKKPGTLDDFSAVVTGIILALSLPPNLPFWAAAIGSAFAIAIGKMVFGGLGANIFNPAMVGRAFLTASFGMMMTTWTVPATINSDMPRITPEGIVTKATTIYSDMSGVQDLNDTNIQNVQDSGTADSSVDVNNQAVQSVQNTLVIENGKGPDRYIDARTRQSPLALSKEAQKNKTGARLVNRQIKVAFWGEIGGCLGETSALALLIGGIYLLVRRTINFHIPLAVLLSASIFAAIAYLINPDAYISPLCHLCTGGLLIGTFFIATDPVTAPLTRRGMWIFGIGVGTITMLIRIVGEYPEGMMYSILLMNAVTPLIDRFCRRIPTGGRPSA